MTKNDNFTNDSIWKLSIISAEYFLPSLEEVMYATAGDAYPSIATFEIPGNPDHKIMEVYFNGKPDEAKIKTALAEVSGIFKISPPVYQLVQMADKDWVTESQKLLKPIEAGRFYLFGNHDAKTLPSNKIPIVMEAGQAFGTGSHGTTNGCLLAIDALRNEITPERVLDLGCGSGVLSIAMAKIWNCKIIASDNDPISTKTTLENLNSNAINITDMNSETPGVAVITASGFEDDMIAHNGPFDLIVSNILAGPLKNLAPEISGNLSEKGMIVLSGLLREQENYVLSAYENLGMVLKSAHPINEWQTLVLGHEN